MLAATSARGPGGRHPATDQRIVIFGAGTAGVGIADQLRDAMVGDGLRRGGATRRIWCVDRQGLLTDDMAGLRDFQVDIRPAVLSESWDWAGDGGSAWPRWSQRPADHPDRDLDACTARSPRRSSGRWPRHIERPMIFPMSNPTELIEAVPGDLIHWTGGRGLVGTGTPWRRFGTTASLCDRPGQQRPDLPRDRARHDRLAGEPRDRSDAAAAADALRIAGRCRPSRQRCAPSIENLRSTSATVALGVARQAIEEGVAQVDLPDPERAVRDAMWTAALTPLELDLTTAGRATSCRSACAWRSARRAEGALSRTG